MPRTSHHGFWQAPTVVIPEGPGITPIRYASEYMVFTYSFSDGRDLDTRTKLLDPNIGDYMGWARASSIDTDLFVWGGDNTGTGQEAVAFDVTKFKETYPTRQTVKLEFRCFWFGTQGYLPVYLSAVLYKGGDLVKNGYSWTNPTAWSRLNVSSASSTITAVSRNSSFNGQGLARLTYQVYTGVGYLERL